jgi:hypothetical protein
MPDKIRSRLDGSPDQGAKPCLKAKEKAPRREPLPENVVVALLYAAVFHSANYENCNCQKSQANENCSNVHAAPPFLWRCHPTQTDATPMGIPSQLSGEIIAPTMHPAPKVRKKSSQYFILPPLNK